MSRIAFVGLGNMGSPMSRRLIEAGHEVVGSDPAEAARDRLIEAGGEVAGSAPEAARGASAVVLMLPNSAVVAAVADELLAADALAAGSIVIDMSSSEPLATRALRDRLAERDVRLADAPVSGGVKGAVAGSLTIMLGSDAADRDELHALLAPLGRVVDCGEVGAGHALKALNNLMSATHLWATSEAMEVGRRFGLDPQVVLDVVNGSSGRSGSTDNKWPNFILPGTYDSGFGLRLMLKDMRIAAALADDLGAPLALGAEAIARWAEAAESLPADADHTRVAEWIAANADAGRPAEG
ncbi:NAD(P)-dependent oxidoreductase [Microbacterium marinilacus]|uniref:NAD(P)-dependent oxidoreductase n=1 Tax=Microbacterium marinilacus TaxID=415209 RepID=A0ABP7BKS9_9MICO|nr:NAD(P)-dependent oxidoreductase [Microbacterium marinilacus]MBY0689727.1 NAD(P)-dependent oxidoreductase [Microbacterium marinilacus]